MPRKILWPLCIGVLASGFVAPLSAQPTLDLSTADAAAGSEVEISWRAEGSSSAFLSGYGAVPASGSRKLRATEPALYVLITEGPSGVSVVSRRLRVHGGKGEEPIDPAAFSYPFRDRLTIGSLTRLCDRIQGILQNDLGFSIRPPYEIPREKLVFITYPAVQSQLVGSDENKIGARRLAYLVELTIPEKLPADVQLTISTWIQYRRRMEATWRPEESEALHRQGARLLRERILSSLQGATP
jgi:hypothetical protein